MAMNLDIHSMSMELSDAGVNLSSHIGNMDSEEFYNYIIHQYDITFLQIGWQFQEETASLVYQLRNSKGHKWTKAWRRNGS